MAGILCMPRRDSFPEEKKDFPKDWKLAQCPKCGADCFTSATTRRLLASGHGYSCACTTCALGTMKDDEVERSQATEM